MLMGLLLCASAGRIHAEPSFLEELQKTLACTTNVQSDFVQEKTLSLLQQTVVIKGRLAVEQPAHLSWQVLEPIRYNMVLEGTTMRQWDEATGKIQTMSLAGNPVVKVVVTQLQAWFSGRFDALTNDFDIVVAESGSVPKLVFTPKAGGFLDKVIKRVEMTFRGDKRYIHDMVIEEKTGDRTRMVFTNTVLNASIPATVWEVMSNGK
jgi:outer membrane lipoprotein carrier protein